MRLLLVVTCILLNAKLSICAPKPTKGLLSLALNSKDNFFDDKKWWNKGDADSSNNKKEYVKDTQQVAVNLEADLETHIEENVSIDESNDVRIKENSDEDTQIENIESSQIEEFKDLDVISDHIKNIKHKKTDNGDNRTDKRGEIEENEYTETSDVKVDNYDIQQYVTDISNKAIISSSQKQDGINKRIKEFDNYDIQQYAADISEEDKISSWQKEDSIDKRVREVIDKYLTKVFLGLVTDELEDTKSPLTSALHTKNDYLIDQHIEGPGAEYSEDLQTEHW